MTLIADALLIAGALAAAFYCWILSARVKSLKDLDNGLGAAIAALSGKVDDMQTALRVTQKVTGDSRTDIEGMTSRAEKAAEDLTDLLDRVEAAERREQNRDARRTQTPSRRDAKAGGKPEIKIDEPLRRAEQAEPNPVPVIEEDARARHADDGVVQPLNRRRTAPTVLSNAEKLQREIRDRLADRDRAEESATGSDDVVKTIQSLLVAARQ